MSEKTYDLYDLEDKYQQSLDDCKKFLVSKGRVVKGTKISKSRIDYMVSINATCPLCGAIFNGKNSNTEHILPLGLGGKNVANNKIQLCVACNSAKNNLIQSYLGQHHLLKMRKVFSSHAVPMRLQSSWPIGAQ